MESKYIKYTDYLKRKQDLNRLEKKGFKLLYKKNRFKVVVGVGCLVVGFITLPIPTGSIFIIGFGFMLLGFNRIDIYKFKENLLRKFKVFIKLKGGLRKWNI